MRKGVGILAVLLLTVTLAMAQEAPCLLPHKVDEACKQWVNEKLSQMSVNEKVGQTFVYTLAPDASKKNKKLLRQVLKKYNIGGLLYSEGNPDEQADLTNFAQQESIIPLMITFDGEWGPAMRLQGTPAFPKNIA